MRVTPPSANEHENSMFNVVRFRRARLPIRSQEPDRLGGAREKPGCSTPRRSREEPGGARESQEEPGGARRSQEEPGGARRSQEEPWRSVTIGKSVCSWA